MEPADLFLSRLIETSWFSPLWRKIKHFVAQNLDGSSFQDLELDPALEKLLLLHICGPSMRKQWNMSDEYRPELLLEPYLSSRALMAIQNKGLTQLCGDVGRAVQALEVREEQHIAAHCTTGGKILDSPGSGGGMTAGEAAAPDLLLFQFRAEMVRIYNQFLHLTSSSPCSTSGRGTGTATGLSVGTEDLSRVAQQAHSAQLGAALLTSYSTQDLVVSSLITACFEPHMLGAADCVSVQNFSNPSGNHSGSSYVQQMRIHPLDPGAEVQDLDSLLRHFRREDIDLLCRRYLGRYLPTPLRQCILTFRSLHKTYAEVAVAVAVSGGTSSTVGVGASDSSRSAPTVVCVNELLRQGALKGVHDIVDRCPHSDLVTRMVLIAVVQSASISVDPLAVVAAVTAESAGVPGCSDAAVGSSNTQHPGAIPGRGAFQVTADMNRLARRTEHLVYGTYLLTNTVTQRSVNIALLLMRIFPEDSPVSEKILRIFRRITQEVLPSEQLHREYSVGSVAMRTFDLLFERDREFYDHFMQHTEGSMLGTGSSTAATPAPIPGPAEPPPSMLGDIITDKKSLLKLHHSRSNLNTTPVESHPVHPPVEPGADNHLGGSSISTIELLRGWLECGFAGGWFNLPTTLYLWDVLMCIGWEGSSGVTVAVPKRSAAGVEPGSAGILVLDTVSSGTDTPLTTKELKLVPATVESMIARICFVLLQLLRKPIMESGRTHNLAPLLRKEGFKLRTKLVAEAMTRGIVHSPDLRMPDAGVQGRYDEHKDQLRRLQQAATTANVRSKLAQSVVCESLNVSENSVLHQLVPALPQQFIWRPEGPASPGPTSTYPSAHPSRPSSSGNDKAPTEETSPAPSAPADDKLAQTPNTEHVGVPQPAQTESGGKAGTDNTASDSSNILDTTPGTGTDIESAPAARLKPNAPDSPRSSAGKFAKSRSSSSRMLLTPTPPTSSQEPATDPGDAASSPPSEALVRSPVLTEEQAAARPSQDVIDRELQEYQQEQQKKLHQSQNQQPAGGKE